MPIRFHKSLAVANAVVSMVMGLEENYEDLILRDLQPDFSKGFVCSVQSYQNGREQGLCLEFYDAAYETTKTFIGGESKNMTVSTCYYICENRHGDDVTVYVGPPSFFQLPDDKTYYEGRNTFGEKGLLEAAKFILKDAAERINKKLTASRTEVLDPVFADK